MVRVTGAPLMGSKVDIARTIGKEPVVHAFRARWLGGTGPDHGRAQRRVIA